LLETVVNENIPAPIPTVIPIMDRGIITLNAPKSGIRAIFSGMTRSIPINPPRSMGIKGGET